MSFLNCTSAEGLGLKICYLGGKVSNSLEIQSNFPVVDKYAAFGKSFIFQSNIIHMGKLFLFNPLEQLLMSGRMGEVQTSAV